MAAAETGDIGLYMPLPGLIAAGLTAGDGTGGGCVYADDGVGDTNPERVPLLGVADDIVATGEGREALALLFSPI